MIGVFKRITVFLSGAFRRISLRIRNLRMITVLAMSIVSLLAMVIFSLLVFQKMQSIIEDTTVTNTQQVVNQTAATLDSYVAGMLNISAVISEELKQIYFPPSDLQDFLDNSQAMGGDIVSMALFNGDGIIEFYAPKEFEIKPGTTLANQQWYLEEQEQIRVYGPNGAHTFTFSSPHVQNLFYDYYAWVITLYTQVRVQGQDFIMAIDMSFSTIDDYCSKVNIGKRGYAFVIGENGKIVYHPQQQMIYAGIKEEDIAFISGKEDGAYIYNGDVVVVISSLDSVGWKTVGISYLQDNQDTINDIYRYMFISFFAVFILILLFAAAIARYISLPIGRVIKTMETASDNHFTAKVHEAGYAEVRRLSTAYNHMTGIITELMDQIKREQRELRKTEIRALQAQINPHFLYNTLDSILWMCEKGDNEGAVIMVSALGTLFRISLNKGKEIVTVKEELSHAENYLKIQEVRYKDQFTYHIDAPEELLDKKVPKILIQPFLENAIYHGFGHSMDKGRINIGVSSRDEKLLITVEDNGVGIPQEMLNRINNGGVVSKSGIGIQNVNSRIQIYFGKDYGVTLHSVADEGTRIEIWLPVDVTEDDMIE